MSFNQHERHVSRRSGGLPEKTRQERSKRRPELRAYGTVAYASAYSVMEEEQARREERRIIRQLTGADAGRPYWRVEYLRALHSDFAPGAVREEWLPASKSMQGKTLQGAINLTAGQEGYRIMVKCGHGWSKLRTNGKN